MMPSAWVVVAAITLATRLLVGCSTAPTTPTERDELIRKAQAERQEWNKLDPGIEALAKKSHGIVFFPEIIKGGLGVAGGYGRGVVYEQGHHIGYAVIAKTGASKNARFVDGVAVFVRPITGAMAEAAVGGQRVTYVPK
jgi:hypothetical protein